MPAVADGGAVVILMILGGLVARIISAAKQGKLTEDARPRLGAAPTDAPASQSMSGLLEEMRTELERARRKAAIEARTVHPKAPLPATTSRTRPAAVTRTQRPSATAVESIRPERAVVDYDAEAEQLVAKRMQAAITKSKGRSGNEHDEFDQRIRGEAPAPQHASRHLSRLKSAMIWREILGPPPGLLPPGD